MPFLSLLVVTYRRPEKLERLLCSLLSPAWSGAVARGIEIIVADDHGEDPSRFRAQPILEELRARGWGARYVYRERNLGGDRNLYEGFTRDAAGEYVWFVCDDDQIDAGLAAGFIEGVAAARPAAALCGFSQGENGQFANRLGPAPCVVRDDAEVVRLLTHFPKTSAYVLRRPCDGRFDGDFERWERTLFAWVGLSILTYAEARPAGVFIDPRRIAYADEDFGELRYGFRIFRNLHRVAREAVDKSTLDGAAPLRALRDAVEDDELTLCLRGLQAHYNPRSHISYTRDVLSAELEYLRDNARRVPGSPRRLFGLLKLLYRYAESHVHRIG